MERRSRCRDRIAAPLVCLVLACGLSACGDGYPKKNVGLGNPTSGASATDIVRQLNRMNGESLTATQWTFSLLGPCNLRLVGRGNEQQERILTVELLHGDLQVKGNLGGPVYAVQVDFADRPELVDGHLFEAERWTDAVEYATYLQALQRICAASRYAESQLPAASTPPPVN